MAIVPLLGLVFVAVFSSPLLAGLALLSLLALLFAVSVEPLSGLLLVPAVFLAGWLLHPEGGFLWFALYMLLVFLAAVYWIVHITIKEERSFKKF